jgi:urease accessory protein
MSVAALTEGVLNPLMVPAHILAWLGLGLLIGGGRAGESLAPLVAFALGLAGGLWAIALAFGQTPAGDVLLCAAALIGLLVALAVALPNFLCVLIALIVGAALGLDSPPQVIAMTDATLALAGTWFGACLALGFVSVCAGLLTRDWQRSGMRILGSWIAASAILVLALRFTRGMLFGM